MKKILLLNLFLTLALNIQIAAQEESPDHTITLSTYIDGYYAGYNTNARSSAFRPFTTVGARGNSIGVNVAQFGIKYEHEIVRSNLILHYGDIPQATWSSDYNYIQEGNVGVKLGDGIWFDAGAFATHIGTESFLPKNNMLSSTAFKTYNEPFYQTGAKLTYDRPENLEFQFWILNGYNSFVDNNKSKSIGVLVNYNLNENTSITYTNLLGREESYNSSIKKNRFYQNIYVNTSAQDRVFLTAGFDLGIQTNSDLIDPDKTAVMFAGVLTARYQFDPKWSVTGRAEIFNDKSGFISGVIHNHDGDVTGVELLGFTIGSEYRPVDNTYLRIETRLTRGADYLEVFAKDGVLQNNRAELLITMGLELEKILKI